MSPFVFPFSKKELCFAATRQLLNEIGVPVTDTTLAKDLRVNPSYPSLLAISETLNNYRVESVAVKTNIDKLLNFPPPFLVQLQENDTRSDTFTVINAIDNQSVSYFNTKENKYKKIPYQSFIEQWTGVALLAEAHEDAGEKDYRIRQQEETVKKILSWTMLFILPILTIDSIVTSLVQRDFELWPSIYILLTLLGTITASLLVWYELDKYNPVVQQLCSGDKKMDCDAVLHSTGSKFLGLSWTVIGFSYFVGNLLVQLTTGITSPGTRAILGWMSILASPYIIFSFYYQWKVVKQWCVLCLTTQGILFAQLVTTLIAGFHLTEFQLSANLVSSMLLAYLIPLSTLIAIISLNKEKKSGTANQTNLIRMKRNPEIFSALLSRQQSFNRQPKDMGIRLGNPDAPIHIVKVCNPYCGPCAKAHPVLEQLMENNPDVQLQVIFNATNNEKDARAFPVRHLMAIAEKEDEEKTKEALNAWYLSKEKVYDTFAEKFPMKGELARQGNKLNMMLEWCKEEKITHTPTIFINGRRLPEIYTISDLSHFI